MDQNWMDFPRGSGEFKRALNAFLDESFSKDAIGGQILCPCKRCSRRYCHSRDEIYDHLIVNGFVKGFKEWILQREASSSTCNNDNQTGDIYDDMFGLLHDTFRDVDESINDDQGVSNGPNEEAKNFYRLVEEGKQELYEGCKTFSKLSFMIRLFLFKCLNGVSNAAFDDLLELLREAFPMARLPKSYYESKKIISYSKLTMMKKKGSPTLKKKQVAQPVLTPYEEARTSNIEKNAQKFKELGLDALAQQLLEKIENMKAKTAVNEKDSNVENNDQDYELDNNDDHDTDEDNTSIIPHKAVSSASTLISSQNKKVRTRSYAPQKAKKKPLCPALSMDDFLLMQQEVDPLEAHQLELDVQKLEQERLQSKRQTSSVVVSENQEENATSPNEGWCRASSITSPSLVHIYQIVVK